MIPGISGTFGAGSAPSFQGGASSGGNQENSWGDNTGSQMIMGSNAKIQNYVISAFIGGAVIWLLTRRK